MGRTGTTLSLALVLHERDRYFDLGRTVIGEVLQCLSAEDCAVHVVRGPRDFKPADVAFAHVDLTRIPDDYRELLSRYSRVINGSITDISKRAISQDLVTADSDYSGPVIVKTNANCGGEPELAMLSSWRRLEHRFRRRIQVFWPPRFWLGRCCYILSSAYPIFPTLQNVPAGAYTNPHLVVEKFRPERDGDSYCVRSHSFLGERSYDALRKYSHPLTKGSHQISSEEVECHPDVLRWRAEAGVEYGKIDYAFSDGRAVIFDVNTTPTILSSGPPLTKTRIAPRLALGMKSLLREAG